MIKTKNCSYCDGKMEFLAEKWICKNCTPDWVKGLKNNNIRGK